jgi:hypothetical protein
MNGPVLFFNRLIAFQGVEYQDDSTRKNHVPGAAVFVRALRSPPGPLAQVAPSFRSKLAHFCWSVPPAGGAVSAAARDKHLRELPVPTGTTVCLELVMPLAQILLGPRSI